MLGLNEAEYTDGILMITQFQNPNNIYPPFYSLISYFFGCFGMFPEFGGKLVSALFSSLVIYPLYYIVKEISDIKPARYACLLYFISPVPLRWGIRVMSDSLFTFMFLSSIAFLFSYYRDSYSSDEPKSDYENDQNEKILLVGSFFAVIATLTHYRGIILLPVTAAAFVFAFVKERRFSGKILFANCLWFFIPIWILNRGFRHFSQIEERMGGNIIETLLNYLNIFESFVFLLPYFITVPAAFFIIYGIFKGNIFDRKKKVFSFISAALILELLILQSVFSSFQERYLLPIFPLLIAFGGIGISVFQREVQPLAKGKAIFKTVLIITIIYGVLFSLAVCYLQRGAFGDLKKAGKFLAGLKVPETTEIYSNEFYKSDLNAVKISFWAKKKIKLIKDPASMKSGSIVVLHSAYGGMNSFNGFIDFITNSYDVEFLASFKSEIVPLLPDIMQEPGTHQNPAAFVFRYKKQEFETVIYKINGKKSGDKNNFPMKF